MSIRLTTRRAQAALLAIALLLVTALGAASAYYSHQHLREKQAYLVRMHRKDADAHRMLLLMAESQVAIRQWLLSGRVEDRDASLRAGDALREQGRALAARLEVPLLQRGLPPFTEALEHMLRLRDQAHATMDQAGVEAARTSAVRGGSRETAAQMRRTLNDFRNQLDVDLARVDDDLRWGQMLGMGLIGASSLAMLAMLLGAMLQLARRRAAAEGARADMDRRGQQVATLFRMGELLQSSLGQDDVRRVVAHTARELLPDLGGAFYVFNNSRDRLDLLTAWPGGDGPAPAVPEHVAPQDCWALKRGRPHGCGTSGGLRCDHATMPQGCAMCIPMQARGEVYGLLQLLPQAGHLDLEGTRGELARALADGVSLSLANLALREKLRSQALRDELTGLYNRRFLDETLPRLVAHAERRQMPIAVLMLDLDHFKQVNDRHGHAMGDAVLREVGAALLGRLRRMDVACRYGGEELMVLLPDCSAMDALARANDLCGLVRGLRDRVDTTLPAVTVSIGVAAWPDHGEQIGRVIEAADAALYAAKRAGRDRAMPAEAAAPALAMAAE